MSRIVETIWRFVLWWDLMNYVTKPQLIKIKILNQIIVI
jgi:hypothetical protein